MIYPDALNVTFLVEKIGVMVIVSILIGAVSMNGHSYAKM